MKRISLPETKSIKAIDTLKAVVSMPQERGVNLTDMRQRLRVVRALEKSDGVALLLEDADYALLSQALRAFSFGVVSDDIIATADAVEAAEDFEVT